MTQARFSLLALAGALLLLGCSHAQTPTALTKAAGDGLVGNVGESLSQPLVVKVTDADGHPVAGVTVLWSVLEGEGSVTAIIPTTGDDGRASATATLGPMAASHRFQAATQNWAIYPVVFQAGHSPFTLSYSDPAVGGKLRLVRNSASTPTSVTLDLVVAPGATITAYSAGLNLPLDPSKVTLDLATPMIPGKALNPGSAPAAAMATLPQSGPLKGTLVSGQSQKASGIGAVTTDTVLPAGSVLYSVKLNILPAAKLGVVFDGTAAGFALRSAGARNLVGTTVVSSNEVAIGKLLVK